MTESSSLVTNLARATARSARHSACVLSQLYSCCAMQNRLSARTAKPSATACRALWIWTSRPRKQLPLVVAAVMRALQRTGRPRRSFASSRRSQGRRARPASSTASSSCRRGHFNAAKIADPSMPRDPRPANESQGTRVAPRVARRPARRRHARALPRTSSYPVDTEHGHTARRPTPAPHTPAPQYAPSRARPLPRGTRCPSTSILPFTGDRARNWRPVRSSSW